MDETTYMIGLLRETDSWKKIIPLLPKEMPSDLVVHFLIVLVSRFRGTRLVTGDGMDVYTDYGSIDYVGME